MKFASAFLLFGTILTASVPVRGKKPVITADPPIVKILPETPEIPDAGRDTKLTRRLELIERVRAPLPIDGGLYRGVKMSVEVLFATEEVDEDRDSAVLLVHANDLTQAQIFLYRNGDWMLVEETYR